MIIETLCLKRLQQLRSVEHVTKNCQLTNLAKGDVDPANLMHIGFIADMVNVWIAHRNVELYGGH